MSGGMDSAIVDTAEYDEGGDAVKRDQDLQQQGEDKRRVENNVIVLTGGAHGIGKAV